MTRRLIAMTVLCALPVVAVAQQAFREGDIPPHRLFEISPGVARTQTFAADGASFDLVQFMLTPGAGRLVVEVRSTDLQRRYGFGHIAGNDPSFGWKSVSWDEAPTLVVDRDYAFVLRGEPLSGASRHLFPASIWRFASDTWTVP